MTVSLAPDHGEAKTAMIDVTYLAAHRTATNMAVAKGAWPPDRPDQGRHEHKAALYL